MNKKSKVLSGVLLSFALMSSSLMGVSTPVAQAYQYVPPNDPKLGEQWYLDNLDMKSVWGRANAENQIVAVIDTGITQHGDLDKNVLPGYDMVDSPLRARDNTGRDDNPQDEGNYFFNNQPVPDPLCALNKDTDSVWHGTHVAGIIAAEHNNGRGIAGIAPGAKVLPVRVSASCGVYDLDLADGISWAAGKENISEPYKPIFFAPKNENIATVINISQGETPGPCTQEVQEAINYATSRNIPVVVAAGNLSEEASNYSPSNCDNVIVVASSDKSNQLSDFSNFASVSHPQNSADITAPGGSNTKKEYILSTYNKGTTKPVYTDAAEKEGYKGITGTSMATPIVSGVVALMRAADPTLTPSQIEERIKRTATAMPECAAKCGAGLINPMQAIPDSEIKNGGLDITGERIVGKSLEVDSSYWTPSELTISYQWTRDTRPIENANSKSYVLTSEDVNKSIAVEVTGSKRGYKTQTFYAKNAFPVVADTPKIIPGDVMVTGKYEVGQTLNVSPGVWSPSNVNFYYQWYATEPFDENIGYYWSVPIPFANSPTYTLKTSDVGKHISVRLEAYAGGFDNIDAESDLESSPLVQPAPIVKNSLTTTPSAITGTMKVGNRLTINHAPWGPAPVAITYQWYRNGVAISGATGISYLLTADDLGKVMTVHVTGRKTGYTAVYRKSSPTIAIGYGDLKGNFPVLSGTTKVGNNLTANPGLWTPGVTVSYTWYRDGVLVPNAVGKYYKLTTADLGKQIKVRVLGKKTGYQSRAYYSYSTVKITQ